MTARAVCLALVALLPAGCSEETTHSDETGAETAQADTGSDAVGGSFDVPGPDGPNPCTGVCYRALDPAEYPEAENPPRQAIHCGERGVAGMCPSGTTCAPAVQTSAGWRVPVCEPIGDTVTRLDLDVPLDGSASLADAGAVPVEVRLILAGQPLPDRVATSEIWGSRISFTHRESHAQWSEPIPATSGDTFELGLRPGVHDVVAFLRRADFTGAVPDAVFRGELEVVEAGGVSLELGAAPLTVSLRYSDSPLTSAESAAMRLTLLGSGGRRFDYQLNGGERGRAALLLPAGEWRMTVTANGLRSLFPAVPLDPAVTLVLPGDETLSVDLDPIWVSGAITVDGEPVAGRVHFVHGGASQVAFLNDEDVVGQFRALLWAHQPYSILYESPLGEVSLVESAWLPDGEPLALALETTDFTVAVELSGPLGTVNLGVVNPAFPTGSARWLQMTRSEGSTAFFDLRYGADQQLDFWLQVWSVGMPQGPTRLAARLPTEDVTLAPEVGELFVDASVLTPDGREVEFYGTLELLGEVTPQFSSRTSMPLQSPLLPMTVAVYEGEYDVGFWPGWHDWGLTNMRFAMGRVDVEGNTALDLGIDTRAVRGSVTLDGEELGEPSPAWGQRGQVRLQTVWGSPWVPLDPIGEATFEGVVGPAYYDVGVLCSTVECVDAGLSVAPVALYDAVWLGGAQ